VLVRKELADSGRLREPAGLRGLRVAFTGKGHNTQMLADALLAQAGLTIQDVEPLEMPYTDMNTAIANNNLDAAVSIEPFIAIAMNMGYGVRWKSWADVLPNDQVASVLYSAGFADDRTEVARRYAKGWVRAVRDYEAARTRGVDREEIIAILLRDTALKDRALYDTMPWVAINPNGRVSVEAITAAQDWFAANGYVPRKIDLGQVIDHQFADYAVRELGPYRP
jgi:NitT/TauT family transport system substrate-binding protein